MKAAVYSRLRTTNIWETFHRFCQKTIQKKSQNIRKLTLYSIEMLTLCSTPGSDFANKWNFEKNISFNNSFLTILDNVHILWEKKNSFYVQLLAVLTIRFQFSLSLKKFGAIMRGTTAHYLLPAVHHLECNAVPKQNLSSWTSSAFNSYKIK